MDNEAALQKPVCEPAWSFSYTCVYLVIRAGRIQELFFRGGSRVIHICPKIGNLYSRAEGFGLLKPRLYNIITVAMLKLHPLQSIKKGTLLFVSLTLQSCRMK